MMMVAVVVVKLVLFFELPWRVSPA